MILYNSSELPRVMVCPGSAALSRQAPKADKTDDAQEGIAFHHFAAELCQGRPVALGDRAPNGFACNAEMLEYAKQYADLLTGDPAWTNRIESAMHWGPGGAAHDAQPWQVRVKVDNVTWRPDLATLAVTDAKYGFRFVPVEDNWQLLSQAIGACFALNVQPQRIILAIWQPRIGGEALRWIEITPEELLTAYSVLCAHLDNITDTLVTSAHCGRCPAVAGCPAHKRAAFNAVDVILNGSTFQPETEGLRSRLEVLTRAEEMVKQHKKALEAHALNELRQGKILPGMSTKTRKGNRRWLPHITLQTMREKGNNFIDEVICLPAEAERRGLDKRECATMTERPDLGVTVVLEDASAQAARVFGDASGKPKRKGGKS